MGDTESGVRTVYPFSCCENRPVSVFCDQTTDGGGWTVFQHREDLLQREDFFRSWVEYQLGFGNLTGEFWLGLENIHALVSQTLMELRVDLEDFEGEKRWAKYDFFHIEDSLSKYKLRLGAYEDKGDAGDSLSRQNGQAFSAKDQDNDIDDKRHCADLFRGGWWYRNCHRSNLNGFQHKGPDTPNSEGINWKEFHGLSYSLKSTGLSIRPRFTN
ncbi:UNVERIFIED_CONTAM: hypothetical protein GTU68_005204 [Idotea baltica]|nr:hypothetical protein [Idotea baltica]